MEELVDKLIDYLMKIPIMNKEMMIGIIGRFKTKEQCQEFLAWIQKQNLETIKEETMLIKAKQIMKT